MTGGRPVVAVVPFGARVARAVEKQRDERPGAWARQIARRLVDRLAAEPELDARPLFLVAVPDAETQAGYLVFGSTPDAALAASYGASLGATYVLTGTYVEDGAGRSLRAELVGVERRAPVATLSRDIPPGGLPEVEAALAAWLLDRLGIAPASIPAPPTASEAAYAALLSGMDAEMDAALLREGDPAGAGAAARAAAAGFVEALRADPAFEAAEERLLVGAARSLEHGDLGPYLESLEAFIEVAPRSWRAHYLLGELRESSGDAAGAVVAFEHADALHPLSDDDSVRLAELYARLDAPGSAAARLRRVRPESPAYARAQTALGAVALARGDAAAASAAFERAVGSGAGGWRALAASATLLHGAGDLAAAIARYGEAIEAGAPAETRLERARALLASGDRAGALPDLDAAAASGPGPASAQARRLLLGLRHPDREATLEAAGRVALAADAPRFDEARRLLTELLATDPDLWEAHFALGLLARREGDAEGAERSFRDALERWPDQPDALHELGVALLLREAAPEAVAALERAAALRPDDAAYLADAGYARLRSGDVAAARRHLERSRALAPEDQITSAYLAELARVESEERPPVRPN